MPLRSALPALVVALLTPAACGGTSESATDTTAADTLDDTGTEADSAETDSADGDTAEADTVSPPALPDGIAPTITTPAADPFAAGQRESCPIFEETRCNAGAVERCAVYDTGLHGWAETLDPLLRRVLLYDRYFDLYTSADGQTGERQFDQAMPADTDEAVWGDPAHFAGWAGEGDSAIWTGVALIADTYRYAVTGTEADYARMERRLRTSLTMFDVTGVPGYLARYHFLWAPAGSPQTDQHFVRVGGDETLGRRDHAIEDPTAVPDLPAEYLTGYPDGAGGTFAATPMWNGRPSIDQYSGPTVAYPIVWDLIRDDALKARMAEHMRCYLNRLQRIEIHHLQANETVRELVTSYFAGDALVLDPGDIDLTQTDDVVLFVLRELNETNKATYDRSCPDGPPTTPAVVYDAADEDFLAQLFGLVGDMQDDDTKPERAAAITHAYAPSLRGGDAGHLLQIAAAVWRMTGDDRYRAFIEDDLIATIHADEVALTAQAFRLPDWCISFYGDHITYPAFWQLLTALGESPLRRTMLRVMDEELWQKALVSHRSAKFDVMYASLGEDATLAARAQILSDIPDILAGFGGPEGHLDAPRRTYDLRRADVAAAMDTAGLATRCPTEAERERCEAGLTVLGVTVAGEDISHTCDGRAAECTMADGMCTDALAAEGLPVSLREYADFAWQRDPFAIGDPHGLDGTKQSPGRDLAEPYWMARYYGLVSGGAGQVLAWKDTGESCAE
ncbi:MAG: hypothetical protein EP329_06845 [Deltaproteobacteria bacterium]|nr:MAG: hypothetical protein EP329_06845 [Deltaproteobacteria bacterium]